ncbi:MAG: hypothetical protein ACREID_07560 [Planctomycetota bacterium]
MRAFAFLLALAFAAPLAPAEERISYRKAVQVDPDYKSPWTKERIAAVLQEHDWRERRARRIEAEELAMPPPEIVREYVVVDEECGACWDVPIHVAFGFDRCWPRVGFDVGFGGHFRHHRHRHR